jgi:hypothetical protein
VVGVFDAGRTGFNSEIWAMPSSCCSPFGASPFGCDLKLVDSDRFDAVKSAIEDDPQLTVEAKRETQFYADQSQALSKFIFYLGTTISVIFSIGAIIGAMITMYASVASRTNEIGTLRRWDSRARPSWWRSWARRCCWARGRAGGSGRRGVHAGLSISTMNFQTFAEIAFGFSLTPESCWPRSPSR